MAKKNKPRNKLTPRQQKLIRERAKGKTLEQAALSAGYSAKNARQSGYQAMNEIRGRVPELLNKHDLSEDTLIDKYLRPLLNAEETVFFQKDGKIKQQVNVAALGIRHSALRTAFELHGSYAPKDPKEAAQYGVKIVQVDIVRPPGYFRQFIDVPPQKPKPMTPPTNGKPPADSNGHD